MASSFDTITPTLQQVSDLVRTRLVTEGGHAADVFSPDTYPSDQQAERLIEQAANAIFVQLPGSVAEPWAPAGQHLAALYAAILIEASYFREQLTDDQVQLYRDLLISGIKGLGAAISGDQSQERMHVDTVVQRSIASTPPWVAIMRDLADLEAEALP
jgi:hypothetical protein